MALLAVAMVPPGGAVTAAEPATFSRISGDTRVETAAGISRTHFEPGVDVAFVARADDFRDALAAGPLAARAAGPILLTHSGSLPDATAAELARLRPGRLVVLGGARAVSEAVVRELAPLAEGGVRRVAGGDRFATAAAVATERHEPGVPVAYVATGVAFPDALVAGVAAAREGGPVLLVTSAGVPQPTAAALRDLRPGRVILLGGRGAVSDDVAARLGQLSGAPVERLAGPDRVATAVAVSQRAFPDGAPELFLATAGDFPDSLAGVPAAYRRAAPLLLAPERLTETLVREIQRLDPSRVTVLGGRNAVSAEVFAAVEQLLNGGASPGAPPPAGPAPPPPGASPSPGDEPSPGEDRLPADEDPAGLIGVWYGREQAAGGNGLPQTRANIAGSVAPPVTSLHYQVNGASPVRLRLGPDGTRLVQAGDFNIEIAFAELRAGANDVLLTARDAGNRVVARRWVRLRYHGGSPLPLPYRVEWDRAGRIDDVAQVVDGRWVRGSTVRTTQVGYDRLVAVGDRRWTDYEVRVPVTVHRRAHSPLDAVGLVLRWTGHTLSSSGATEPRVGYYPLGALPIYNFNLGRLEIQGNNNDHGPVPPRLRFDWEVGVTYVMKARVRTLSGGGSHYQLKVWRQGQAEPGAWMLTLDQAQSNDHPAGSVLLLAHHVDASFGTVTVTRP